jgi:hypothetical protein
MGWIARILERTDNQLHQKDIDDAIHSIRRAITEHSSFTAEEKVHIMNEARRQFKMSMKSEQTQLCEKAKEIKQAMTNFK